MKKPSIRWQLVLYDIAIFLILEFLLLFVYSPSSLSFEGALVQIAISFVCIFTARIFGKVYGQVWRYGGIQCYIRLLVVDGIAFFANFLIENLLPIEHIVFSQLLAIACMNCLGILAVRMIYRYAYKFYNTDTCHGRFLYLLLRVFAGMKKKSESTAAESKKIRLAIMGAGRFGVSLAEELTANRNSIYEPCCFVDTSTRKANRDIHGIPVLLDNDDVFERLSQLGVQEVVFAGPDLAEEKKQEIYKKYLTAGYKLKLYDAPLMSDAGGKAQMREFDIEDLLFRKSVTMDKQMVHAYYRDKVILITGGGGSIGSELCRQLAKASPRQIVILDIYENGAYDVQQELRIAYGGKLRVGIEIASINNERAMRRVFEEYRPEIVINAAAHKHVPLMEKNCIEAVENNVFGAEILIKLCEEYGAERFMMVSTDKAVNPTNVMGATKRMCEMMVQSASTYGNVKYSSTRFGNVLGSAGSVIPLFKKQIANGGPITLTDKRIIRYFMTIPEATQLVLQSGAMAKNGELFVLDMGQPVRILELAQNMIRLSGVRGIDIIETGLRPGEKLYEELLVKTEELDKTENSLIFIERDTPLSKGEIDEKLRMLRAACASENDERVREALHAAVPTFRTPEEVNADVRTSEDATREAVLAGV